MDPRDRPDRAVMVSGEHVDPRASRCEALAGCLAEARTAPGDEDDSIPQDRVSDVVVPAEVSQAEAETGVAGQHGEIECPIEQMGHRGAPSGSREIWSAASSPKTTRPCSKRLRSRRSLTIPQASRP